MNSDNCATLSVEVAGELLGIGRSAAYAAARNGLIPAIRLGPKLMRVPKAALARLLGAPSIEDVVNAELPGARQ